MRSNVVMCERAHMCACAYVYVCAGMLRTRVRVHARVDAGAARRAHTGGARAFQVELLDKAARPDGGTAFGMPPVSAAAGGARVLARPRARAHVRTRTRVRRASAVARAHMRAPRALALV